MCLIFLKANTIDPGTSQFYTWITNCKWLWCSSGQIYINILYSMTVVAKEHLSQKEYSISKRMYIHLEGKRGGGGHFFTQVEPNWPLPYSTVHAVQWLRDARPAGWVTFCSKCASTMPRAKDRAEKGSILL